MKPASSSCKPQSFVPKETFEDSAAWKTLLKHIHGCTTAGCCCRAFAKKFPSWWPHLPADSSKTLAVHPGESWLWFRFTKDGLFRWHCLLCHGDAAAHDDQQVQTKIQKSSLLVHHGSTLHLANVAKVMPCAVNFVAPSKALFKELLYAFQHRATPTGGVELASGRVSFDKANAMLWCLYEGWSDTRLEHLKLAETLNVIRDERHGRMHVRFRADTWIGYAGQSRGHNPDSLGLTEATVGVYKRVATRRANPPKGAVVETTFDQDGFDHCCGITEATSIDSAENEVVSARDMSTSRDGVPAPFPNNNHILRDAAHSGRRVLSRLFKADKVLDYTFNFFMLVASLIQFLMSTKGETA